MPQPSINTACKFSHNNETTIYTLDTLRLALFVQRGSLSQTYTIGWAIVVMSGPVRLLKQSDYNTVMVL